MADFEIFGGGADAKRDTLRAAESLARRRGSGAVIYLGKRRVADIRRDCRGRLWTDLTWFGAQIVGVSRAADDITADEAETFAGFFE